LLQFLILIFKKRDNIFLYHCIIHLAQAVLCRDILQTAADVLWNLPPMSLGDESKMPTLGSQSLCEVSKFLKLVVTPASNADMESMNEKSVKTG